MIQTEYSGTVKGDLVDKLEKGFFQFLHVTIMVKMLGIDVCNDRHRGTEQKKGTVAFIGFSYEKITPPSLALVPKLLSLPPITMVGSMPP